MLTLKRIVDEISDGSLTPEEAVPLIVKLRDEQPDEDDDQDGHDEEEVPEAESAYERTTRHMRDGTDTEWHPNSRMYLFSLQFSDRVTPEQFKLLEAAAEEQSRRSERNERRRELYRLAKVSENPPA